MKRWTIGFILSVGVAGCLGATESTGGGDDVPKTVAGLKNAASFREIKNDGERAVAMFVEAGKVLQHPRCVNCHPAGNRPLQTDAQELHQPPVVRGEDGHGVAGLKCQTCHQSENVKTVVASIPGHADWHLAPASMAWEGESLASICAQIKDRSRNGDRSMEELVHHMAEDSLVGWGWNPGPGRQPLPGTQEVFGSLIRAWAAAGGPCPPESSAVASTKN